MPCWVYGWVLGWTCIVFTTWRRLFVFLDRGPRSLRWDQIRHVVLSAEHSRDDTKRVLQRIGPRLQTLDNVSGRHVNLVKLTPNLYMLNIRGWYFYDLACVHLLIHNQSVGNPHFDWGIIGRQGPHLVSLRLYMMCGVHLLGSLLTSCQEHCNELACIYIEAGDIEATDWMTRLLFPRLVEFGFGTGFHFLYENIANVVMFVKNNPTIRHLALACLGPNHIRSMLSILYGLESLSLFYCLYVYDIILSGIRHHPSLRRVSTTYFQCGRSRDTIPWNDMVVCSNWHHSLRAFQNRYCCKHRCASWGYEHRPE